MSRNLWNTKLFTNNEHTSTFPDSRSTVLLRDDVSNRNMLKNPFNTKNEAPPIGGLRPTMITADKLGNVFARSKVGLVEGVTNINMLQNPNNNFSDPVLEPRVLTMQLIKDINNKKLPKYITENKGVGELAYRLLSVMLNNGVKLMTIEMLRSYISGKKFTTILDPGGQRVGRAIAYYEQLLSDAKKLQKLGQLDSNINLILDKYTKGLVSVFGETVLQPVDYTQIDEAMKQLALMSGVLSRLFNQQNALEPSNLVPFETLMGLDKPIDSLIQHNKPNFFLEGQKDNLPNAPQIQDPDITEIPLVPVQEPTQAPTAEVPIQAQEGIKPPVLEKEAKSNIIRNALIAGGLTAAAIGIAYFYNVGIGIERARQAQAILAHQALPPPPPGAPIALAAGLPPAADAAAMGGAVAQAQQAANVLQAINARVADQVPVQLDIAGGVADAVMGAIEEKKDDPAVYQPLRLDPMVKKAYEQMATQTYEKKTKEKMKALLNRWANLPEVKQRVEIGAMSEKDIAIEFNKKRLKKMFFSMVKQYNENPTVVEQKRISTLVNQFAAQQAQMDLDKATKEASKQIVDNILQAVMSDSKKAELLSEVVPEVAQVAAVSMPVPDPNNPVLLFNYSTDAFRQKVGYDRFLQLFREYEQSNKNMTLEKFMESKTGQQMKPTVVPSLSVPPIEKPSEIRSLFTKDEIADFKEEYSEIQGPKEGFNEFLMTKLRERYPSAPPTVVAPTEVGEPLEAAYIGELGSLKNFQGSFVPIAQLFNSQMEAKQIAKVIENEIIDMVQPNEKKSVFKKLARKYLEDRRKLGSTPAKGNELVEKAKRMLKLDDNGDFTEDGRTKEGKKRYSDTLETLLLHDVVNNIMPAIIKREQSMPITVPVKSIGNGRKRSTKKAHTTKVTSKEIKNIDDEIMRILTRR